MSTNLGSRDGEAHRLRELLKGRFNQETALNLIEKHGGLLDALNFILTAKSEEVQEFLQKDPSYVASVQRDAEKVSSLLENGIKATVRLFACQRCNRYWWRRVPGRKEVSRCKTCKARYDPIPKDLEWGFGKFICMCGNEFSSFGEMGITYSECYKCGEMVLISHMLPPRKDKLRKTQSKHSCDAKDCISRGYGGFGGTSSGGQSHDGWNQNAVAIFDGRAVPAYRAPQMSLNSQNGPQYFSLGAQAATEPSCVHPRNKYVIRTFSRPHKSSGSTVTTFLSQGSLDDCAESCRSSLYSIHEDDK